MTLPLQAVDDLDDDIAPSREFPLLITDGASPAQLEAEASWFLRRVVQIDAALDRLQERTARERELLDACYRRQSDPLKARRQELLDYCERVAAQIEFPGKRKSIRLAYGEIGRRRHPEHLEQRDEAAILVWAVQSAPELVGARVRVPLIELQDTLPGYVDTAKLEVPARALADHVKATGEIPPGCELVPEKDVAFARAIAPEPPANTDRIEEASP